MSRQGRHWSWLFAWSAWCMSAAGGGSLLAEEPRNAGESQPALQAPYALLSLRSIQRTRVCIDFICESILRPDVGDGVAESISETVSAGLKLDCLDPERPLGLMLVLQPPAPQAPPAVNVIAPAVDVTSPDGPLSAVPDPIQKVEFVYDENGELVEIPVDASPVGVEVSESATAFVDMTEFLGATTSVLFATVTDFPAAHKMLRDALSGGQLLERCGDRDDLYIVRGDDQVVTAAIRLNGDRAYLGTTANVSLIDSVGELAETPDELGARHDFSASVQVRHLSPQARRILSDAL
jgi:hypothetical protein